MPTPIIGDKFLTQRDVNSSLSEQKGRSQHSPEDSLSSSSKRDSVELRPSHLDEPIRPLSDEIRSADQAKARMQQLLSSFRSSPEAVMNAQANPSQARAEILLQTPG